MLSYYFWQILRMGLGSPALKTESSCEPLYIYIYIYIYIHKYLYVYIYIYTHTTTPALEGSGALVCGSDRTALEEDANI